MTIKVLYFGIVSEITNRMEEYLENIFSIHELKDYLLRSFPLLEDYTFIFSVNQRVCKSDCKLNDGDEIAILPPFAGG